MVEGGLGVTLLPEITLKAGILNGHALVARPFAQPRAVADARARRAPRRRARPGRRFAGNVRHRARGAEGEGGFARPPPGVRVESGRGLALSQRKSGRLPSARDPAD